MLSSQNNQLFAIYHIKVKPEKITKWEADSKEYVELRRKAGIAGPYWFGNTRENFESIWAFPMESFADLDKIYQAFSPENQKKEIGEANYARLNHPEYLEWVKQRAVLLRADLSILHPEGTDLSDQLYVRWTKYSYAPEDAEKMQALFKKFKAFFQKNGVDNHYGIYQYVLSSDEQAGFIAVTRAKNAVDMAQRDASNNEKLKGAEWDALVAEWLTVIKGTEIMNGRHRPELSYLPEKTD